MADPPNNVKDAWKRAFDGVFLNIMVGMTQAESVEEDFAKLQAQVRLKTKKQLERIAQYAGEYYAEHASPNPGKLTEQEANQLTAAAIEYALEAFEDEEE